jgi:predicted nucleotidyltransferase
MNAKAHNIHMVEIVASGLKGLLSEMVFVGGATASLYLPDPETKTESSVRPTDDVDCVVEVASRAEYSRLERRLRNLGFKNSTEQGTSICRWLYSGVNVDIIPTDPRILGFSNRWYKEGIANAIPFKLSSGLDIRIFSVAYFLASKIEAFNARGKNDFHGSRDFEDIITVLDGREGISRDINKVTQTVQSFLLHQA